MKTLQEKIAVMRAALDGKPVEFRDRFGSEWARLENPKDLGWNWDKFDFRVKPTPIKVYFIAHNGAPDLSSANFCKPTCDSRDIAAGYSVVEFIEVIK